MEDKIEKLIYEIAKFLISSEFAWIAKTIHSRITVRKWLVTAKERRWSFDNQFDFLMTQLIKNTLQPLILLALNAVLPLYIAFGSKEIGKLEFQIILMLVVGLVLGFWIWKKLVQPIRNGDNYYAYMWVAIVIGGIVQTIAGRLMAMGKWHEYIYIYVCA